MRRAGRVRTAARVSGPRTTTLGLRVRTGVHAAYAWLLRDRPSTPGESYVLLGVTSWCACRAATTRVPRAPRGQQPRQRPWLAVGAPVRGATPSRRRASAVRYAISREDGDETVAVLTLRLADPASANFGVEFELELPRLEDVDFLGGPRTGSARRGGVAPGRPMRGVLAGRRRGRRAGRHVVPRRRGARRTWWRPRRRGRKRDERPAGASSPWNALPRCDAPAWTGEEDKMQDHSFWELFDDDALRDERNDPDAPRLDDATSAGSGPRAPRAGQAPVSTCSWTRSRRMRFPAAGRQRANYRARSCRCRSAWTWWRGV